MSDSRGTARRVLVSGSRVAVDDEGRLAEHTQDAVADAFPIGPTLRLTPPDVERPILLEVLEAAAPSPDVAWADPADVDEPADLVAPVRSAVSAYLGRAPLPPRRQEWFAAPWRAEADAWVDSTLAGLGRRRTGPSVPVKVWSLSAVLRVPTDEGPAFLKATCEHFRSEPRITDVLGGLLPGRVPALSGYEPERGWQLMEPLPGVSDEDDPTAGLAAPTAAAIAGMQRDCVAHVAQLRAAGCPDRGLDSTLAAFHDVLAGSPELRLLRDDQLAAARAAVPEIERRLVELAAYDVPATLVHGDLHLGNVAHHDGRLTVFDWSDASVGHPFIDLVTLTRSSPPEEQDALVAAYVEAWREALPGADLDRVVELAGVAERVFQAVTYERLQAAQEDAAVWVMEGVVARCLVRVTELVAG